MKRTLIALVTTAICLIPSAVRAEIRVEFARDRHCRSYTATYTPRGFQPYVIRLQAGQDFQIHNMDEFVSLVDLITPSGKKIGDFLMSPGEVKSIELPESGNYRIIPANDKDFYDLRFCAY